MFPSAFVSASIIKALPYVLALACSLPFPSLPSPYSLSLSLITLSSPLSMATCASVFTKQRAPFLGPVCLVSFPSANSSIQIARARNWDACICVNNKYLVPNPPFHVQQRNTCAYGCASKFVLLRPTNSVSFSIWVRNAGLLRQVCTVGET